MSKSKKLNRRQQALLDDLFAGPWDEQEVLDKHNVSQGTYERWFAEPHFAALFERRIARAQRQSRMLLARYAHVAASTLVKLAHSDNPETARKACLDIIALPSPAARKGPGDVPRVPGAPAALSPETASRLLAALAREDSP
jgi:hypothetical protein